MINESVIYVSRKYSHITQPTKLLINNIISNQKIMPKTAAKRKEVNGESNEEVASRRGRFPRGTAAAESPVVPLVVMPESALHARVSTPSLIETSPAHVSTPSSIKTSPPKSRRGLFCSTAAAELPVVALIVTPEAASHARVSTPSSIETSPPSNLSTAFYAESSAFIKKSTSSVIKKKAEYIDFCDSAQVKKECLKYIKTAAELPVDQQTQISFLVRKFNASAITTAFSMLISKVAGAAPIAFFPLPSKKEELVQSFLCLIYDTKSMMINTEEECYRYVKKYSDSEYFIFC